MPSTAKMQPNNKCTRRRVRFRILQTIREGIPGRESVLQDRGPVASEDLTQTHSLEQCVVRNLGMEIQRPLIYTQIRGYEIIRADADVCATSLDFEVLGLKRHIVL